MNIALHHTGHAIDPRRQIALIIAERILEGMGFNVGFTDHIKTQLVSDIEERWIIGVMRCTDCIEIELLHLNEIGAHIGRTHYTTSLAIEIVAIDSIENHALTVYQEISTFDCYITEADALRESLDNQSAWILELYM